MYGGRKSGEDILTRDGSETLRVYASIGTVEGINAFNNAIIDMMYVV